MQSEFDNPEHHRQRSEFIRAFVQLQMDQPCTNERYARDAPRTIFQYWHDLQALPQDVHECIASWVRWKESGFLHRLFDARTAKAFIARSLDERHERAFDLCYHPAMQADYFRLCYLLVNGGLYVDADDVCVSGEIGGLFEGGRLKLQPLCYNIDSGLMVGPAEFLRPDSYSPNCIFYFNNNPLVAGPAHPVIESALRRATDLLLNADGAMLPEIQSTTGPGILSKSIFHFGADFGDVGAHLCVLRNWESIAVSRWPLSYRNDSRNWRLSNQRSFRRTGVIAE